ncbi:putative membrane protein [Hyphomonas neptunium ATCC 15444]|uniref:Uncharacterized protein n=2 Tax=Hyphomonas TaxID=85 RepID=A0A059F900_9PROT|nr:MULTISPECIES: hypothetical protein [Hyphomonas]ABI78561.1 putative membrane protein [Hyphomonas neptunium ATCC 15444]KCZ87082.1 hypothetical protein HHI_16402 [Hyphomonas hirschiana VP5]
MTARLAIFPLISAAWGGALAALKPAALWLILFAVAGGLYTAALRSETGFWMPVGAAILAFLAGTELSRRIYRALMPGAKAPFLPLAHANLSAYAAFVFIGFFVIFFLMMLPGILMQEAGQYQLDKDTDPAVAQEAFMSMLATPYGAVFMLCCGVGAALLGWIALRLTLYGAATSARGEAHVFRTWGLTKGHLKALLPASLATHILPFALGVAINSALHRALPDTPLGHFIGGAAGVIVFAPFLLAGHGMAAAAWEKLKPAEPAAPPPSSGD